MFEIVSNFNKDIFFQIYNLSGINPVLDNLMIFGADYLIVIIFIMAILLMFRKNDKYKKAFILAIVSISIIFIILLTISQFWFQPRPFTTLQIKPLITFVPEPSFPSRHTTILVILALSYAFYKSRFALLITVAAIWTGFARIFVGVHYPVDILGGLIVGLVAVSLSWKINKRIVSRFFTQ